MRTRSFLPVMALLPALLFGACSDNDDDDGGQTPTATAPAADGSPTQPATTPAGETTPTPGAFSGSTNPVEATPPAGLTQARLKAVRAARHEGYDRIVFEFEGAQLPGYTVGYVDKAVNCGSGQDVTAFIGGGTAPAAILQVDMRPAAAHDDAGASTAPRDLQPALETIKRAFGTCDFEAVLVYDLALSGKEPFKVSTLTGPPRLVIDIAN